MKKIDFVECINLITDLIEKDNIEVLFFSIKWIKSKTKLPDTIQDNGLFLYQKKEWKINIIKLVDKNNQEYIKFNYLKL